MRLTVALAVGLVAGLVAGLAGLIVPQAANSQDPYPWCAVYGGGMNGASNCGFTTRQQCLATVSGIGGDCEPNPLYNPPRAGKDKSRKSSTGRSDRGPPAVPYYSPSGSWPSYFGD